MIVKLAIDNFITYIIVLVKEKKMAKELYVKRYRVDVIESERGWGQKIDDQVYFDTLEEAKAYQKEVNSKNNLDYVPDIYWRAENPVECFQPVIEPKYLG